MAQNKNRGAQPTPPRAEELDLTTADVVPHERAMPHMRFAFGVWVVVFSILAASILWDSVYGLLFRTSSGG
jgi:hypothetical protein